MRARAPSLLLHRNERNDRVVLLPAREIFPEIQDGTIGAGDAPNEPLESGVPLPGLVRPLVVATRACVLAEKARLIVQPRYGASLLPEKEHPEVRREPASVLLVEHGGSLGAKHDCAHTLKEIHADACRRQVAGVGLVDLHHEALARDVATYRKLGVVTESRIHERELPPTATEKIRHGPISEIRRRDDTFPHQTKPILRNGPFCNRTHSPLHRVETNLYQTGLEHI